MELPDEQHSSRVQEGSETLDLTKDVQDFKKMKKIESGQRNLFSASAGLTLTDSSQILKGKMKEMLNSKFSPNKEEKKIFYISEEEEENYAEFAR